MIPRISILIPIHNRIEISKLGISALVAELDKYKERKSKNLNIDIIVIDDGSTDGSSEFIASRYPDIIIIRGSGDLWWSGSINLGVKYAINELKTDFILLWNDDIFPAPDYFHVLESIVLERKTIKKIIGSKVLQDSNKNVIWSAGGIFNSLSGRMFMITNIDKISSRMIKCDWLPGMGSLIHHELFSEHNLWFDELHFPQYFGDSDFSLQSRKFNYKCEVDTKLVIYNNHEITGLTKKDNIRDFIKTLTSLKSHKQISKNILFYTRHGNFPLVYFGLIWRYILYFGSFFLQKWK